jgi:sporulation protein YlmC with PRC-barrel domain
MLRSSVTAVALGALVVASPLARAADITAKTTGAVRINSSEMRASKILGSSVYDANNQKLGTVQDLVIAKGGQVDEIVVDVGSFLGMGGKNVAVKMSDVKTDNNRLTLDRTKEQLAQAPTYELENKDTGAGKSPSPVTGGNAGSSSR